MAASHFMVLGWTLFARFDEEYESLWASLSEGGVVMKQGRIHGYPSRARVGRGSDGEGHWGIWQEQWA